TAGAGWYQVDWEPAGAGADSAGAAEFAYLVKRATVAVSGASAAARVASRPLPADPAFLAALYAQEVVGYLDAIALAPANAEAISTATGRLAELDPGRPVVVDGAALPAAPLVALADAARFTVAGAAMTLFDARRLRAAEGAVGDAAPPGIAALLATAATELTGDLSHDPTSSPPGAWSFVRGSDLALRVIAPVPSPQGGSPDEIELVFPDPQLRDPQRVLPDSGEVIPLAGVRRTRDALAVRVADPGPLVVLRLERVGVEELGEVAGLAERLEVASEREVAVEEILRCLQAFDDAQARRIEHYSATNTTHLRFGVGAGVQNFEATLAGPYFFDPETGADWAWETFFINGVRWRGESIPEIPLIQPERAAAMPLEITFDRTYRYRLRGTETVDGRDTWVVEFAPAAGPTPAASVDGGAEVGSDSLYRGTVWIDRQLCARVRTRGVQLGLEGEVLSNEETLYYTPVTAEGAPAPWEPGSFVLPLRAVAQQLLSVINATTLVERETRLSALTVNGEGFAERRAATLASDVTMVRETEQGLRYLVQQEGVEGRVVREGYDTDKWFLLGGTFYDDALDYPLPLGGVNYLDLDFRDTGNQLNVFFAGALLAANYAEPRLFGSRVDAGADLFVLAVPVGDQLYRDGEEVEGEEVEQRLGSLALKLGRPLGSRFKLSGEYRVTRHDYGAGEETAEEFVVPVDHYEHDVALAGRYVRSGYSLGGRVGYATRSRWEPWGLPGGSDFHPDHEDFTFWNVSAGKNWYLPRFQKIGAEVVYVDGSDLDRFSKYEFGFFGDTRVHGYQSSKVRAESAWLVHASYGFEIGSLFRLDALADVAWATDEATGLDHELLAGVGLGGTFIGPWQTLVNLDVGVPVAGPDDGFSLYVVFLKLFR
ncbi:MAG TPA: hypothetical protein VHQ65_08365, partial [Thermoanaerobaculia bacterium]|nr:hypothetical protein [Thermoanaerobaculia bacterium]